MTEEQGAEVITRLDNVLLFLQKLEQISQAMLAVELVLLAVACICAVAALWRAIKA